MDSVLGLQYKGGVILATDQTNARSIITYQRNLDKVIPLTSHSAMAVSGPHCDMVNFTEYISKNLELYEISNDGTKLSTESQANYARNELAIALRKGPYQVNTLIGGFDVQSGEASLYFLDYLASLQKIPHGAQGYANMFCSSVMDRDYRADCDEATAVAIIQKCIHEVQTRMIISQPNWMIKIIDKDGIRVHSFGSDPANT